MGIFETKNTLYFKFVNNYIPNHFEVENGNDF